MKTAIFVVMAVCLTAAEQGYAQEGGRYVAVDGQASIRVAPDMATLQLGAQARDIDLEAARSRVLTVTRRFLEFAGDEGIDDDDVQSSSLNIRPEYRWNRDENAQELLGYYVQRDITVRLEDIDKLGRIMEGAVEAGINTVQPPVLGHSQEQQLRRRALALATSDARANAAEIAATLDMSLGAVRSVRASDVVQPQPRYAAMAMREADAMGAETYLTGQITIESRVSAEFDLVAND
jgi:uncharacterized protein YggE